MAGRRTPRKQRRSFLRGVGRAAWLCVSSVWTFLATCALGGAIAMFVAWKVFGLVPVAVTSGSMVPALPVRSLIFVQTVDPSEVHVGDIITFDAPGEKVGRVTHRVVDIDRRDGQLYFETKGDANRTRDDWSKFLPAPKTRSTTQVKDGKAQTATWQEWAPGVSYGNGQAVRYVWGVPYLGRLVELSARPRLRLGIVLALIGVLGVMLLAQIWLVPRSTERRRRERIARARARARDRARRAAIIRELAAGSEPGVATRAGPVEEVPATTGVAVPPALSIRGGALVVRVPHDDGVVVDVHRLRVPAQAWDGRTVATVVVDAYNIMQEQLEELAPAPNDTSFDAVPLDAGALRALLVRHARSDPASAGRASFHAANLPTLVSRAAEDLGHASQLPGQEQQELLLLLVALDATARHLGIMSFRVAQGAAQRRIQSLGRISSAGAAAMALLAFTGVGATGATLIDKTTMATVSVTGDQLRPTPSMSFVSSSGGASSNLQSSWTTPTGIPPSSYDFWRSTSPGVSTAGAPTANLAASPWNVNLAQCSTYYFKSRSRFASMVSADSAEFSWLHDGTGPVITNYTAYGTQGLAPVSGWVKQNGAYELYANVTDNCAAASALIVTATISTIDSVAAAPVTMSYCTPNCGPAGGPATYNYRLLLRTTKNPLAEGTYTIKIDATDPAANHLNPATQVSQTVQVDNTAPANTRAPVLVADKTNYYSIEATRGAVSQGLGFRLLSSFTDTGGSGVSPATGGSRATISNISTSGTVDLTTTGGPFTTENGINDWTYRSPTGGSAPLAKNPLADGNYAISLVTQDSVGNSRTDNFNGRVDSTRPTLTACTDINGGTAGSLDNNDITRLQFSESMEPGSFVSTWNDGAASFTGLQYKVYDGNFLLGIALAKDLIYYEGTQIQNSLVLADTYDLGSYGWVSGIFVQGFALFNNGTIDRIAGQSGARWELVYKGTSPPSLARPTGVATPAAETFNLKTSGSGLWDEAGNNVSTASILCGTAAW